LQEDLSPVFEPNCIAIAIGVIAHLDKGHHFLITDAELLLLLLSIPAVQIFQD
jgi:hypothetical protein